MRILLFSTYFYPYTSGLSKYPYLVLKHLSEKHEITVHTFPHSYSLSKTEIVDDIKIMRVPYFFKLSKGYISPQSIIFFLSAVQKNDYIVLNLPNFEGLSLAFFAKLFGKKVISIFLCEVQLGQDLISRLISFFLNLSVFLQLLLSDVIVAIPDYINHSFSGKIFQKKIKTVLPPINTLPVSKRARKKFLTLRKENLWIGFVGRTAKEKGLEYLIEATEILRKKNIEVELVFAGPYGKEVTGEYQYYRKILDLLQTKKIPHLFFGFLEENYLGAFYRTIDVLVLPSVNQTEAFGMVQAEAMLLGTPVVASNLPGVRVPIKMTKMGILVPPKNPQALAEAILKISKNRQKYTNPNLVKKAQAIFNSKKTFTFYDKLFDSFNNETIGKKF